MDLGDLIRPEGVIAQLEASNKKQVLQKLAAHAADMAGLDQRKVYETLWQRERLGSTAIGKGIAIPHGRLVGLKQIVCGFARLAEPIDFEASDGEPVDLVFLLLAPEHAGADHLKALARISRLLREPLAIEKLRGGKSKAAIYAVLTEPLASSTNAA